MPRLRATRVAGYDAAARMKRRPDLFAQRREYSEARLTTVRERVSALPDLPSDLCIYVTGSYGRLEASAFSDLDIFFLKLGSQEARPLSVISKALLDADLIRLGRDLEFPEFSGDGEYLTIHYLDDIVKRLGGREDDFHNHFTARLLLLLESRALFNEQLYRDFINDLVQVYYRDYPDHETKLRPLFLANDIMRFWKTLCLNYEHGRNQDGSPETRGRAKLKNLKLKFSRLLTCYSMIIALSRGDIVLQANDVAVLVETQPLERLREVAPLSDDGPCLFDGIQNEYAWFLQRTDVPKDEFINSMTDTDWDDALDHARQFGAWMFDLLVAVTANSNTLRYLVI